MTLREKIELIYDKAVATNKNVTVELSDKEIAAILIGKLDLQIEEMANVKNTDVLVSDKMDKNAVENQSKFKEFWLNKINIQETRQDGSIVYRLPYYRGYGVLIKNEQLTDFKNKESIYYPGDPNNRAVRLIVNSESNYQLLKLPNQTDYFENAPEHITGDNLNNKLAWKQQKELEQYDKWKEQQQSQKNENEEPVR